MKKIFFYCSCILCLSFLIAVPPTHELTADFWNSPSFVRSFMGDYGFRSEVEPKISKSEQSILQEVVAKAENQLEDAIIYLEKKMEDKSSAALHFALGTMYYQNGRLTRSEESYNLAIKKFPSFLRAYKNLGFVGLSLGNFESAAKNLSRSISLGEGDGVTYVALGYCHYMRQRFMSAENAYRMGTLLSPDSKYAQNGLVNCLIETSRFPEALALLDELLATQPEDVICHRARVHALQGLGKERESTVAMETLKRMGQLKTQDLLNLGDLYHNLNLYELSLQNYQLAIEKKERISLHRYVRAASILMNRASYEDCFQYLEKIQQLLGSNFTPEDERKVLLLKAEVLQATGQTKESTAILRKIVEMHPLEGKALIMLGRHAWQDKDYVLASLHFERASKIDEFEAPALIEHGRMMVGIRNYEKAVRLLERAEDIDPQPRISRFLESIRNLLLTARVRL